MRTKKRLTAFLPSTPCTPEMRESLVEKAKREGKSLADLQRSAIALFLSSSDSITIRKDGHSIEKTPQPAAERMS